MYKEDLKEIVIINSRITLIEEKISKLKHALKCPGFYRAEIKLVCIETTSEEIHYSQLDAEEYIKEQLVSLEQELNTLNIKLLIY